MVTEWKSKATAIKYAKEYLTMEDQFHLIIKDGQKCASQITGVSYSKARGLHLYHATGCIKVAPELVRPLYMLRTGKANDHVDLLGSSALSIIKALQGLKTEL